MARLHVRVQPGARRAGWSGWYGDIPKLSVPVPPVDGAANAAVVEVIAEQLDVRSRQVRLVGGASSRTKRFEIEPLSQAELMQRIVERNPRPPAP
ncbi:MAG TPA: DUF167 domain-containing protein [Ilumatobacter sp.]